MFLGVVNLVARLEAVTNPSLDINVPFISMFLKTSEVSIEKEVKLHLSNYSCDNDWQQKYFLGVHQAITLDFIKFMIENKSGPTCVHILATGVYIKNF